MEHISMANEDKKQESTFPWANISIILIAVVTIGYFLVTQYSSNSEEPLTNPVVSDALPTKPEPIPETIETVVNPPITEIKEKQPITFFDNTPKVPNNESDSESGVETTQKPATTPTVLLESTEEIQDNYTDVLQATDQSIYNALAKFSLQTADIKAKLHDDMLRNTVVFIENFSHGHFVAKFSPVLTPKKPFVTQQQGDKLVIDPTSYQRYDIYADYINSMDSKEFAQYYRELKPSIDGFYAEIAKPNTKFDDALNQAIDMVLATPVIYTPIEVNSPSVMYLYNDSALENLNDAQKLLLRLGPKNLAQIKHKLRSIQAALSITQ